MERPALYRPVPKGAPFPVITTENRYVPDLAAALTLFGHLAHQPREMLAFAYLGPKRRLLGMRHTQSGGAHAAEVPFRDVVADAIAFAATGIVLAHNHPGGDPTPSDADLAATRRLARALDAIDVRLIDHVILAGAHSASLRAMALL